VQTFSPRNHLHNLRLRSIDEIDDDFRGWIRARTTSASSGISTASRHSYNRLQWPRKHPSSPAPSAAVSLEVARPLSDCNAWNSFAQEEVANASPQPYTFGGAGSPVPIDAVDADVAPRISTNLPNLDRVLGGGLVLGAVTLVGGEPGVGKSTLLLQAAERLARDGRVLYVSGEESPRQIAMRARRLGTTNSNIHLFAETSWNASSPRSKKCAPPR